MKLCRQMVLSLAPIALAVAGATELLAAGIDDNAATSLQSARSGAKRYSRAEAILPQNIDNLVRQISVRPKWIEKGAQFWFERQGAQGSEFMLVDPDKGTVVPMFDHSGLLKALSDITGEIQDQRSLRLQDAAYNEKKDDFSFRLGGRRWVYTISKNQLIEKKAGDRDDEDVESPNGQWRAFVRDHNLFVAPTAGGPEIRLTDDGTPEHPYARPVVNVKAMIAQGSETPLLPPDISWSPDSRRLVAYRVDDGEARRLALVQSTPPEGAMPRVLEYVYTLTGDPTPPTASAMIFDVPTGRRVDLAMPPEPILYYGGLEFEWAEDGSALFTRVASRGYKELALRRFDGETGQMSVLTADRSETYVDYYGHFWGHEPKWGVHFWTADSTGWAHVYVIDEKTGRRRALTSGQWRARGVAGTDKEGKAVLIVGSGREKGRDPYLRTLYRVPLKGGKPRVLTPEPLDHDVSASPDGRYFVDNMSLIDRPTISVLRRAGDGQIVMELGRADISAFTAAGYKLPEPFQTVAADGKTWIYGAIYRPSDLDPAKRYPVIENIYTGPHYVMTPKSFEAALKGRNAASVAELGFVAVTIDGPGTWGRSRAFQQVAYGKLHTVGLDDHIAGIRAMAAKYPYMDTSRVGVYGFSAGGYDVLRAMTRRPDFYKVGVSASGNHDNRLDKAQWNEQWLGAELGPVYDENSNMTWARKMTGKLFLAHGELDENVPPAATIRLVDALMKANKDFDFLIVPNAGHFLDDSPYFQRKRWDFFVRHLAGAEPPEGYQIKAFQ